jgi:hypothetical protein
VVGDELRSFHEARVHGSNPTETMNYVGLLTAALAIAWLVVAWRRRRGLGHELRSATAGLLAAVAAALLFALPSPISVLGQELAMPSRLLWEAVPAFRVPTRWQAMLMTALIPLAALGLQAAWTAVARRRGGLALPVALTFAAMVVTFLELSIPAAERRFRTPPVPPAYAAVERTPAGVLAEYPLGSSDIYRFWQRRHGRPLLNGAPSGTLADDARQMLLDPATPGTAEALALLGVTAIAIHPQAHVDTEVPPRAPAAAAGYRLLGRFDGDSVYQVVAPAAGALVTLPGGFAKPTTLPGGDVGHALVSPAGVGSLELTAKASGVVRLTFDAFSPGGVARKVRIAGVGRELQLPVGERTPVSILVQVPRGRSRLLVKVDPAATSEADAVVLSSPRAERGAGEAVVQAEPISPDPGI